VTVLIDGGCATGGRAGAGGGVLWQAVSSAAALIAASPGHQRCVACLDRGAVAGDVCGVDPRSGRSLESAAMWVVYLNMLLALVLAVFIVWWTMGGKFKRRPPREERLTPPDDDPRTGGGAPPR
jgi:hypothetical protein